MVRIRWRLLMGVISLVAAVAVSLPAAAAKVDLGQRLADVWPNSLTQLADIWPNNPLIIWPNGDLLGGGPGSSDDSQAPS